MDLGVLFKAHEVTGAVQIPLKMRLPQAELSSTIQVHSFIYSFVY